MYRNLFGEPRPANFDELSDTFDKLCVDVTTASAEVYEPDPADEPPLAGWTAEITARNDDGDDININTAGFETQEELNEALIDMGVTEIKTPL